MNKQLWPLIPAIILTITLFTRNLFDWNIYSVNVLFWDNWNFWGPMFNTDTSIWDMFNKQHGPHKMGIGYFHLYIVAVLSDWNLRTEALSLIIVTLISSIAFLWLKYRLFQRWNYFDAIIPFLCLGFAHYEIYFNVTNPALNAYPLLLIVCIGLVLTMKDNIAKYALLIILGFFSTYTGFAIFAGLIIPIYCLFESIRAFVRESDTKSRVTPIIATLLSSFGFASFFLDYRFLPAVPNFKFPHDPAYEYVQFLAGYWSHYFKLGNHTEISYLIAIIVVGAATFSIWNCLRFIFKENSEMRRTSVVIAFFVLFSFIFSLNAAIGRVSIHTNAGMTSRYLIFFAPFWIACYMLLTQYKSTLKNSLVSIVFLGLLCYGEWSFQIEQRPNLSSLAQKKSEWVTSYRVNNDFLQSNAETGFKVYPWERDYDRFNTYTQYMEEHNLGFMAD